MSQAGHTINENGRTQQDGGSADKLMKYVERIYVCYTHIPNLKGVS